MVLIKVKEVWFQFTDELELRLSSVKERTINLAM